MNDATNTMLQMMSTPEGWGELAANALLVMAPMSEGSSVVKRMPASDGS
jgi:hypothetical protein